MRAPQQGDVDKITEGKYPLYVFIRFFYPHLAYIIFIIFGGGSLWYWLAMMAHSYRLGLVTFSYQIRIPVGLDICHRGCGCTVLQTVQRHGVYSAVYGTVHYEKTLKSFKIRVGHRPGFGLPCVAILPHCTESDVKQYSLTHSLYYYTLLCW